VSVAETRKRRPRDTRVISGRVSPEMFDAVERIVETGNYVDVTDYIRDMIRKDLKEREIKLQ